MDFILNEAIEEDNEFKLVFTDDSKGELFEKEDEGEELNFIVGVEEEPQDESFYRKVDNQPLKFLNQTRHFNEVIQDSYQEYFGEDDLPELFDPENREEVEFDFSEKNQSKSSKFKNTLLQFENVDNPFFYSIIYELLYNKLNGENIKVENTEKFLGTNLFTDLKKNWKENIAWPFYFWLFWSVSFNKWDIIRAWFFFKILWEKKQISISIQAKFERKK